MPKCRQNAAYIKDKKHFEKYNLKDGKNGTVNDEILKMSPKSCNI